ncbi:MAG: 3-isopropylmalate dehydratase small subunit [Methanosarcinaceae archaeon]|nr:3-isopropylmalate dehydratase small subunit [Methanosarcinaceae archaeon]
MEHKLVGKVWKFGDDVDTDQIIPGSGLIYNTPEELAKFCFESIFPNFYKSVEKGDIVVAGENFGCGSSREHAPMALIGAGISCVVAKSFARIFFRNSINIGLPVIVCADSDKISKGDLIEINLSKGQIFNKTKNEMYKIDPVPNFLMEIIDAGGLISHTSKNMNS